jgi:uncharacterized membrane protein YphA (DoxX/SURF4 family)
VKSPTQAERALVALRLISGIFFLSEGWDKAAWVTNPGLLTSILQRWSETASPPSRWYLDNVAIPGAPLFGPAVFFGEVGAGIAFLLGVWTRIVALATMLMVLNIHFAHDALFHVSFLSRGDGLPVLGGLLALAIGGAALPLSLKRK